MNRFVRLVHEHIGDAIIVLGATAVLLAIELVRRRVGATGGDDVTAIETTIEVASKILGLVLGIIGAIAGYRRFFKGRTFVERVVVRLSTTPVRWMTIADRRCLLHAVDIELENVGSATVWEPSLLVRVRSIEDETEVAIEPRKPSEGIERGRTPGAVTGIEPGETLVEHRRFYVPIEVPVFRVTAEVSTASGNAWHRATTVANTFDAAAETAAEVVAASADG